MNPEQFLDNLIHKYQAYLDKESSLFKAEFFEYNKFPTVQMVFVPLKNIGQITNLKPLNSCIDYYQIESGLYISPSLFKYLNYFEVKNKKNSFIISLDDI